MDYAKKDGTIIVNAQRIDPMPVIIGKEKYPDDILSKLELRGSDVYIIDALKSAENLGNIKALNIVMVGFLAQKTDIQKEIWYEAIRETVKEKFIDLNLKAFDEGYRMAEGYNC